MESGCVIFCEEREQDITAYKFIKKQCESKRFHSLVSYTKYSTSLFYSNICMALHIAVQVMRSATGLLCCCKKCGLNVFACKRWVVFFLVKLAYEGCHVGLKYSSSTYCSCLPEVWFQQDRVLLLQFGSAVNNPTAVVW